MSEETLFKENDMQLTTKDHDPPPKKRCYIGGTQQLHEKTLNPFNQKKGKKKVF